MLGIVAIRIFAVLVWWWPLVSIWCARTYVQASHGYVVWVFVIAFTQRRPGQVESNFYVQNTQALRIRKMMADVFV